MCRLLIVVSLAIVLASCVLFSGCSDRNNVASFTATINENASLSAAQSSALPQIR